ncbi:glycosyltransferase family A protein [Cerasicoccus fimbriatus]|uniref:glycosyltransferase family A protein n=1 Tax=Cerasicoccus fimbriatus TaxID=3014554 RepID=UPI0022B5C140|nr:glycosyltransferase family A protein [Cerasicoccus sp. TK19100]
MEFSQSMAPIALFGYNRPIHFEETLEALSKNVGASESDLHIFCDGSKGEGDREAVRQVREIAQAARGFNCVNVMLCEKNYGLRDNIVKGVTELVNDYGKIIVVEDDIVTSPEFLVYHNRALAHYSECESVMHVSAYMPSLMHKDKLPDTALLRFMSCWGWSTWQRAWSKFRLDSDYFIDRFNDDDIRYLNLDGAFPFWNQLVNNHRNLSRTWAIFWYASIVENNGLSLHVRDSLCKNIGVDGSGTNSHCSSQFEVNYAMKAPVTFPTSIVEDVVMLDALKEAYRTLKPSLFKRLANRFIKYITSS